MKPANGIMARSADRRVVLDLVAVESMEEQRGADPLVEVLLRPAKLLELGAGLDFLGDSSTGPPARGPSGRGSPDRSR